MGGERAELFGSKGDVRIGVARGLWRGDDLLMEQKTLNAIAADGVGFKGVDAATREPIHDGDWLQRGVSCYEVGVVTAALHTASPKPAPSEG